MMDIEVRVIRIERALRAMGYVECQNCFELVNPIEKRISTDKDVCPNCNKDIN